MKAVLLWTIGVILVAWASPVLATVTVIDTTTTKIAETSAGASVQIDIHGVCKIVTGTSALRVMIPFKSAPEWAAFLANAPAQGLVTLSDCCQATGMSCTVTGECCSGNECIAGQCAVNYCNPATGVLGPGWAWQGAGTPADPYRVTNVCELQAMKNNMTASYALVQDIDASATVGWDTGKGFLPVGGGVLLGATSVPFKGRFDGRGHKITGLKINRETLYHIGLFGHTQGATIGDVGITSADVVAGGYGGILVGKAASSTISNAYSTGSIRGVTQGSWLGGLIGQNLNSTVTDSYSGASVSGRGPLGGLVGHVSDNIFLAKIVRSYATGSVTGILDNFAVGGLAGQTGGATIIDTYATGAVSGAQRVGGLVGDAHYWTDILNSYSTGAVTGPACVGSFLGLGGYGVAGTLMPEVRVVNSYGLGAVTATSDPSSPWNGRVGGFVGCRYDVDIFKEIINSSWISTGSFPAIAWTETTGSAISSLSPSYGTDSNNASQFYGSAHSVYSSWDFTNVWESVVGGLPRLQWE